MIKSFGSRAWKAFRRRAYYREKRLKQVLQYTQCWQYISDVREELTETERLRPHEKGEKLSDRG